MLLKCKRISKTLSLGITTYHFWPGAPHQSFILPLLVSANVWIRYIEVKRSCQGQFFRKGSFFHLNLFPSQVFAVLTCPCCGIFMTHGQCDNQHFSSKKKRLIWHLPFCWRRQNEWLEARSFSYGFPDIFKSWGDGQSFFSLFALPASRCPGFLL